MKISSFYLNDISEYDNFIEKFINDIDMKFYKTGHNSLNIGRFINFFRTEITKYIQIKFDKKIHIVLTLPKNDVELIEKSNTSSREQIQICLWYDNIRNILNGEYPEYPEYISMLIEQIDAVVNSEPTHDFNDYLILQMNNLVQICYGELTSSYSKEFIFNNLKKPESWVKLARQSAIFNDYYNFFKQDKAKNKEFFLMFLKKLYSMINF